MRTAKTPRPMTADTALAYALSLAQSPRTATRHGLQRPHAAYAARLERAKTRKMREQLAVIEDKLRVKRATSPRYRHDGTKKKD